MAEPKSKMELQFSPPAAIVICLWPLPRLRGRERAPGEPLLKDFIMQSSMAVRRPVGLPVLAPALLLVLALAPVCLADTVYLRDGNIITGTVVAEKQEFLALDLGFTILEVPTKQVLRVEKGKAGKGQTVEPAKPDEKVLYRQAKLKVRTVKELVAEFGEGIVLVKTPKALGSGFVINEEGYLITNAHVIQGETDISVTLFLREGQSFSKRKVDDVKIVAVNPFLDLALLKVKPPEGLKLTVLCFGDMEEVKTGDPVFAIGNPLGLERTVSEGIVSTKARAHEGIVLIQTTAPINPGNSGGPLLNMRGEVIGVTNMKVAFIAEGLGFAIPIKFVKDFLEFREAYAYDKDNPNTGHYYLSPPHRDGQEKGEPDARADKKDK